MDAQNIITSACDSVLDGLADSMDEIITVAAIAVVRYAVKATVDTVIAASQRPTHR